jgi:hypothetical protein
MWVILSIIQTAINLSEVRQEIKDALVKIPVEMQRAVIAKELYAKYVRVQGAFTSFYIAIVDAVLEVVELLLQSSLGRLVRGIAQQGSYGDKLRRALGTLEECGSQFKQEADLSNKLELCQVSEVQTFSKSIPCWAAQCH